MYVRLVIVVAIKGALLPCSLLLYHSISGVSFSFSCNLITMFFNLRHVAIECCEGHTSGNSINRAVAIASEFLGLRSPEVCFRRADNQSVSAIESLILLRYHLSSGWDLVD